ncbi:unnamed protein product [Prorocentrum cordatum]|uniref:Uncharacterized protein n=1 Tax=Prorocentrum cordatum TaxID=2364126 RepID=A0ABN9TVC9_9DINO|nr:unnamed protein product [Polarella glacialis]
MGGAGRSLVLLGLGRAWGMMVQSPMGEPRAHAALPIRANSSAKRGAAEDRVGAATELPLPRIDIFIECTKNTLTARRSFHVFFSNFDEKINFGVQWRLMLRITLLASRLPLVSWVSMTLSWKE